VSKLILDTQDITDGFFEDTRLLGIMAPMKDYHFCWQINHMLDIDFRVNNDIEIQLKKKNRNYFFSLFEYHESSTSLEHYIYNNQFDGEYLLPEFKHLDFLWLMKGDIVTDDMLQRKAESLRSINGVQLVVELTNEKIKNKEHLIF
jgi:hypothetical protein